jgi:hypothetical protein
LFYFTVVHLLQFIFIFYSTMVSCGRFGHKEGRIFATVKETTWSVFS